LSLTETAIDDAALNRLTALAGLKHVELYRTKISPAGFSQLRQTLPKTSFYGSPELIAAAKKSATERSTNTSESAVPPQTTTEIAVPIVQRLKEADEIPDF